MAQRRLTAITPKSARRHDVPYTVDPR